jgi:hypothetical protein
MMSEDNKARKPKAAKTEAKTEARTRGSYEYRVSHLADALGSNPTAVRARLRNNDVDTNEDGIYGWNRKSDFDAIMKQRPRKRRSPLPRRRRPKRPRNPSHIIAKGACLRARLFFWCLHQGSFCVTLFCRKSGGSNVIRGSAYHTTLSAAF